MLSTNEVVHAEDTICYRDYMCQVSKLQHMYVTGLTLFPPTRFAPVTSTNVGFGPQNILTFSFNPFATLVQNFKFVPTASPKLLNLNQDHPSKTIFLVKSLQH